MTTAGAAGTSRPGKRRPLSLIRPPRPVRSCTVWHGNCAGSAQTTAAVRLPGRTMRRARVFGCSGGGAPRLTPVRSTGRREGRSARVGLPPPAASARHPASCARPTYRALCARPNHPAPRARPIHPAPYRRQVTRAGSGGVTREFAGGAAVGGSGGGFGMTGRRGLRPTSRPGKVPLGGRFPCVIRRAAASARSLLHGVWHGNCAGGAQTTAAARRSRAAR